MTKSAQAPPIDHEEFTVGQVLRALRRLKVKSVVGLVVMISVVGGAVYRFGVSRGSAARDDGARASVDAAAASFADGFAVQFVDRQVLQALVPEIQSENPDGLNSFEEVMASLVWQVKSQKGFAEFLSGRESLAVDVFFADESIKFEWDRRPNLLLRIAENLGVTLDDSSLRQLNAELNVLGIAWLDDLNYVVRGLDGGLKVIGTE